MVSLLFRNEPITFRWVPAGAESATMLTPRNNVTASRHGSRRIPDDTPSAASAGDNRKHTTESFAAFRRLSVLATFGELVTTRRPFLTGLRYKTD